MRSSSGGARDSGAPATARSCQNGSRRSPPKFRRGTAAAGGHLIEHRAKREQIGAASSSLPAHLLGRHVGDGPERRAGAGEMLVGCRGSPCCALRCGRGRAPVTLGQTEVENLGVTALGDENVGGLDVAVNDALPCAASRASAIWMPRSRRLLDLIGRPAMRCFSVCPSRNSMAMKAWPSCFADVVDGADVGMVQGGGGTRFAAGSVRAPAGRGRDRREGISARRSGRG